MNRFNSNLDDGSQPILTLEYQLVRPREVFPSINNVFIAIRRSQRLGLNEVNIWTVLGYKLRWTSTFQSPVGPDDFEPVQMIDTSVAF